MKKPGADVYRKVRFRELAREIVGKDRHDRRAGYAVDTAGNIARALERAYRDGFEAAQIERAEQAPSPESDSARLEWAFIPPRPRTAFWSICLFCLGRADLPKAPGRLVPAVTERGTPGWMLTAADEKEVRVIGEKTIIPLVRLGLLILSENNGPNLIVSERGKATWEQFLDRGGRYPEDLTMSSAIVRS